MATRNATLQGYAIPKGAIIMPDLHSVHNDPHIFPNPETFEPEHFLDKDGAVINAEYCIPFSAGRYKPHKILLHTHVIWCVIWLCGTAVHITYLISHSSFLSCHMVYKRIF